MIRARVPQEPEPRREPNFWISYSDLMAAMLMVFALLLIVAMVHFAELNRRKQQRLNQQEDRLKSFRELQQLLITDLQDALDDESVTIDPETGALRIGSAVLFGEDEAELRPEGKERLDRIFDDYIRIVLDQRFREAVKQIEIEGHTNSRGDYLYNLELSQRRAYNVMRELLDRAGQDRTVLERLVVAGGRSFAVPVLDGRGVEDMARSRRIEIKFRLKEAELFSEIYRDLSQ